MNQKALHHVAGRLSLRAPQRESLEALATAIAATPDMLNPKRDVAILLETLKGEFPKLSDFEREFPSLCFALATGVGKTRLMGAFISYLHLAHGISNFFVLAPNLTIYNKLIYRLYAQYAEICIQGYCRVCGQFAENYYRR